jgi:membrane-bound lytic murein transglycosylase B
MLRVGVMALVGVCAAGMTAAQALNTSEIEGEVIMMPDMGTQAGFDAWLTAFAHRAVAAGIPQTVYGPALTGLTFDKAIINRDRNQSEFTKTIWDYLDTATSDERVTNGRAAMVAHADILAQVEAKYGVDRHVVAAIWGLESAYGSYRGHNSTIAVLSILAYDGRRAAFFEAQLLAALRILANGDVTAGQMTGSWAGAMGHTQFMPTSWWDHAVDFDGDGRRDIWGDDPGDALASTAAYLAHFGWTTGQPWGLEVTLPPGFDYDQTTERVKKSVADWAALGVVPATGGDLPQGGIASVLLPGGARGAAFLIFSNFSVIEKYNTADAYVIAVGHLADRLRGGPPIKSGWPRDLRALAQAERMELQTRLGTAGFDPKGVDGRIGQNTIAAVKAYQKANLLVPDGYASLEILERLRQIMAAQEG